MAPHSKTFLPITAAFTVNSIPHGMTLLEVVHSLLHPTKAEQNYTKPPTDGRSDGHRATDKQTPDFIKANLYL